MAVSRRKQRTLGEHREVHGRAGAEFLVIHVAAEGAWLLRRKPAPTCRRRDAEGAEERIERDHLPPRELAGVRGGIDRGVEKSRLPKVFGQWCHASKRDVPAPILL